jgi:hypothetical protein
LRCPVQPSTRLGCHQRALRDAVLPADVNVEPVGGQRRNGAEALAWAGSEVGSGPSAARRSDRRTTITFKASKVGPGEAYS